MTSSALKAEIGSTVIPQSCVLRLLVIGVAMSLIVVAPPAFAQKYPDRRVSFIVGYEPGGTGDAVGRIIVRGLSEALGRPMVVENRAGASGSIAAQGVAGRHPMDIRSWSVSRPRSPSISITWEASAVIRRRIWCRSRWAASCRSDWWFRPFAVRVAGGSVEGSQ